MYPAVGVRGPVCPLVVWPTQEGGPPSSRTRTPNGTLGRPSTFNTQTRVEHSRDLVEVWSGPFVRNTDHRKER